MNPEKLHQWTTNAEKELETKLLNAVLEEVGDDEKRISDGIEIALRGYPWNERRRYLNRILTQRAKDRIRRARRSIAV